MADDNHAQTERADHIAARRQVLEALMSIAQEIFNLFGERQFACNVNNLVRLYCYFIGYLIICFDRRAQLDLMMVACHQLEQQHQVGQEAFQTLQKLRQAESTDSPQLAALRASPSRCRAADIDNNRPLAPQQDVLSMEPRVPNTAEEPCPTRDAKQHRKSVALPYRPP